MVKKALLILVSVATQAQILIDDFSDGNLSITGNTPFEAHAGSMVGGERRVAIWPGSGLSATVSGGSLTVDKSTTGAVLLIRYGNRIPSNYGGGAESGTPLNLDATGILGVNITALSITGPLDIYLNIQSSDLQFSSASVHFDAAGARGALFTPGGNADLSDIMGIEIMIPQTLANTGIFQIDSITFSPSPIPEPSSYALAFGLVLLALPIVRRLRSC